MHRTATAAITLILLLTAVGRHAEPAEPLPPAAVTSLDGQWLLAPDPQNVGRQGQWHAAARPELDVKCDGSCPE
jgi:hypothetical protein